MTDVDDLWVATRAGSPDARKALTVHYLPIVYQFAGSIHRRILGYIEEPDLVQWGSIGLIEAIDTFDPERSAQFEPYASHKVRYEMMNGIRSLDAVPKGVRRRATGVIRAQEQLAQELGRWPTTEEVAARVPAGSIEIHHRVTQFDRPVVEHNRLNHDGSTLAVSAVHEVRDPRSPDASTVSKSRVDDIAAAVNIAVEAMPERQRRAFEMYYVGHQRYVDIGRELGVSTSTVNALIRRALTEIGAKLK